MELAEGCGLILNMHKPIFRAGAQRNIRIPPKILIVVRLPQRRIIRFSFQFLHISTSKLIISITLMIHFNTISQRIFTRIICQTFNLNMRSILCSFNNFLWSFIHLGTHKTYLTKSLILV